MASFQTRACDNARAIVSTKHPTHQGEIPMYRDRHKRSQSLSLPEKNDYFEEKPSSFDDVRYPRISARLSLPSPPKTGLSRSRPKKKLGTTFKASLAKNQFNFPSLFCIHLGQETQVEYRIRSVLGRGISSIVYLAEALDAEQCPKKVAIKCLEKARNNRDIVSDEVSILEHLDHPQITQLYYFAEDTTHFYLVLRLR